MLSVDIIFLFLLNTSFYCYIGLVDQSSWVQKHKHDKRPPLAFGKSRLQFLRSKWPVYLGVYDILNCTTYYSLILCLVKSFITYSMWWQRTMFGRVYHVFPYLHSDSTSNFFFKSAAIEARNVFMFKVDGAVLVYRVVRDRNSRKRILWRLHKNVRFLLIWYVDDRLTFFLGFDDAVPTMVHPGAGLTRLDLNLDNTDSLFDSIFTALPIPQSVEMESHTPRQTGSVRAYRSNEDM